MGSATISVDEFQALEQKVLLTVDLIRKEREARAIAEGERDALKEQLQHAHTERDTARTEADELRGQIAAAAGTAQAEVESLHREREAVRLRVEKMLSQMDELL
jgi:hypothetical protein